MKEYKKNKFGELWLNCGSGVSLADNFINVDNFFTLADLKKGQKTKKGIYKNARVTKDSQFVKSDICKMPFKDNFADYIECNDVIEHQPIKMIGTFLTEIYRVLKPGCSLGLSTTNFNELARLWSINVASVDFSKEEDWEKYIKLSQVIYGNQAGEGEFHRCAFNPIIIAYYLQVAGFDPRNITIRIFPTNCSEMPPQKAYDHARKDMENTVVLTEMMWVIAKK